MTKKYYNAITQKNKNILSKNKGRYKYKKCQSCGKLIQVKIFTSWVLCDECKEKGIKLKGRDIIIQKIKSKRSKSFNEKLINDLKELNLEILDDYSNAHRKHKFKCLKCNSIFSQRWNNIQQGFLCPTCYPRNMGFSTSELKLIEFIESNGFNVERNKRNIIKPYELDIYISDKDLAIEFHGLWWHSEMYDNNPLSHKNKLKMCQEKNIRLIQIFEDEWNNKQDIVKARLKQILNCNNCNRIHARKCKIKEIDSKTKNLFLEKYHIQGKDSSTIKLGAFYDDEVISVMTFSKGNISKGSKPIEDVWELNRFCSNYDYHIPGIASKLLSHFKRNYEWKQIFSYADLRWSEGNVYNKLNFTYVGNTSCNYWYVKNGNKRYHRFGFRKTTEESKNISEKELRRQQGYYRIWDCGNMKFIMENK